MRPKSKDLSPHSKKILELLNDSKKPLSAYEILAELQGTGISAPQTVYRALNSLVELDLVHRIESLNSFVACHNKEEDHGKQFVICKACKSVLEIHDHRICNFIKEIGKNLRFKIEHEMLELTGLCSQCDI